MHVPVCLLLSRGPAHRGKQRAPVLVSPIIALKVKKERRRLLFVFWDTGAYSTVHAWDTKACVFLRGARVRLDGLWLTLSVYLSLACVHLIPIGQWHLILVPRGQHGCPGHSWGVRESKTGTSDK